uniref:Uncharacterized protein n=1 Tax=Corynebacterium glutamicum TaxID=1718 RepID=P94638_CORGT|nr:unknown [Corynebacterium glutamicum]CAA51240.1 hypothetical protein [Corynebacterium glutamicum]
MRVVRQRDSATKRPARRKAATAAARAEPQQLVNERATAPGRTQTSPGADSRKHPKLVTGGKPRRNFGHRCQRNRRNNPTTAITPGASRQLRGDGQRGQKTSRCRRPTSPTNAHSTATPQARTPAKDALNPGNI